MTKREERRIERLIARAMREQGYPEYWFPHPDSGNYEVSSLGRVRRSAPARGTRPGLILKPWGGTADCGYVGLCENGLRVTLTRAARKEVIE